MMRPLILAALVFAGCGPSGDPLVIKYVFSQGPEQACGVTDCNDMPMNCDSVASLRISDPDNPMRVYVEECQAIPNDGRTHTLCNLNQTPFDLTTEFPTDLVKVELAVYPRAELEVDGVITCPQLAFTASGFAAPGNSPRPALAGLGYADGYDKEIVITLGCNDTVLIDTPECRNENAIDISSSVIDFDTSVSVGPTLAQDLTVRVGEPELQDLAWIFDVTSTVELPLITTTPEPNWHADDLDLELVNFACIQVLEVAPRSTPALTCRELPESIPPALDLPGVRVNGSTLTQVLDALCAAQVPPCVNGDFPGQGLVLGVVVDFTGSAVAGATVTNSAGGEVKYLSSNLNSITGTSTSASGVFVSTDATFDAPGGGPNLWSALAPPLVTRTASIGGLVKNRLTVIVIQLDLETM
jgi:hypothetical protein